MSNMAEEIVEKLVRQGVVPDELNFRNLAKETIESITRQRVRRVVRQVIEAFTKEPGVHNQDRN